MEDDGEISDARPLLSFDNFVNNQPSNLQRLHRNPNSTAATAESCPIPMKYTGRVMLGSFPKMMIILFGVGIAAYTTEITFASTDSASAARSVCYENPKAETSGARICHSLMGVAISSILVCMLLMIFDVFIPCVDIKFRRLAHALSLLLSFTMGMMLFVTSSMMANLYVKYCDYVKDHYQPYPDNHYIDYPPKCGDDEHHFLILPLLGFATIVAWGLNGLISLIRILANV